MKNITRRCAGVFILLAPVLIIVAIGISSLVIDLGTIRLANAQLRYATDAAALATVNAMAQGKTSDEAVTAGKTTAAYHTIIGSSAPVNVTVTLGDWDENTKTFTPTNSSPNAAQVTSDEVSLPVFFAKFFSSSNSSETIASLSVAALPKSKVDVMFMVDVTLPLSQYSRLSAFPGQSVSTITTNSKAIFTTLNLTTLNKSNMTWNGTVYPGTTTNQDLLDKLGLKTVTYPFPQPPSGAPFSGGSWTAYFNYVKTDPSLLAAGYRNNYGYLTFTDYLLSQQPSIGQTSTLWKTAEQPLQTIKDSINNFMNKYLDANNDRAGLITGYGGVESIDQKFTNIFSNINQVLRGTPNAANPRPGRQAYQIISVTGDGGVNSSLTLTSSLYEFIWRGSQEKNTQWVLFFITAGNIASNSANATFLLNHDVPLAKNHNIVVNIIVVGSIGNFALMKTIAEATGGQAVQISPFALFGDTMGNMIIGKGAAGLVN